VATYAYCTLHVQNQLSTINGAGLAIGENDCFTGKERRTEPAGCGTETRYSFSDRRG
jgi:hypothetical protein